MAALEQELREHIISNRPLPGRPRKSGGKPTRSPTPLETNINNKFVLRNAELILDHFGMGSLFWPTLQDLADEYKGLETRERARQIIDKYYTKVRPASPLRSVQALVEILKQNTFWLESEFLDELKNANLIDGVRYAKPLLDYVKTQELALDYEVYHPNLEDVSRSSYTDHSDRVIVLDTQKTLLKKTIKKARSIVGTNGLCRIQHINTELDEHHKSTIKNLILINKDAWATEYKGQFWYIFEDRDNTLVNNSEKVFSLVDHCAVDLLSEALKNSLRARVSKFNEFPDAELISRWIQHSNHFRVNNNLARLKGLPTPLQDIEQDVVDFMQGKGALRSPEIHAALKQRGHGEAYIHKKVFTSPLVYVDKSEGRAHYKFTLLSDLTTFNNLPTDDRYNRIKTELQNLEELDMPTETKRRAEQGLLREWLFSGADISDCAICGLTLSTRALITAHKKKRSRCTDSEKRDPYIVFPLCVFGCDHLYEHGFISLSNGIVIQSKNALSEAEASKINDLLDRRVEARWLLGPPSYFDNLPGGNSD